MRTPLAMATTLLAALVWVLALLIDPGPLEALPALLVGIGLLGISTVATIGMIVVGGRWAHRLGLSALAFTIALAVIRAIDPMWVVTVMMTAFALFSLLSPRVLRSIRRLPSAAGPPPRAVLAPLLLVATPAILGLVGNDAVGWALAAVAISAPNFALFYIRVLPGGLLGIRLIWPLVAIGFALPMGLPAGALSAVLGSGVAFIAWNKSVRTAYHPPREVATTFPIPPELAPPEVLDAAEIDERGRRR